MFGNLFSTCRLSCWFSFGTCRLPLFWWGFYDSLVIVAKFGIFLLKNYN